MARMRIQKNGDYTVTIELAPGKEYQLRYLIDKAKRENGRNADN
jgi:hypothetical protein